MANRSQALLASTMVTQPRPSYIRPEVISGGSIAKFIARTLSSSSRNRRRGYRPTGVESASAKAWAYQSRATQSKVNKSRSARAAGRAVEWVLPGGTSKATSELGTGDQTDSGVTRGHSG